MSYLALYRRWRPRRFSEVVGQDPIVRTILQALVAGKTSHAYLFCGSRGTGKTSMAKLLARALNCLEPEAGEPCNRCQNCSLIEGNAFMDLLEIDAASNRGIDEIRELRDRIGLAPAQGRCKVYIIDEVHMLTTEAFNALLKTLEDPPGHAVFILATTEPHRVPMTILSRCQRFDFRRIGLEDMVRRLEEVCGAEEAGAEPGALCLIAKLAEGSLRDALGILDQCLSGAQGPLTEERVADLAGVAQEEFLLEWVDRIAAGDVFGTLQALQQALGEGKQSGQLLRNLQSHFRNLLVLQLDPGETALVPVRSELAEAMRDQAGRLGAFRIQEALQQLSDSQSRIRQESDGVLFLELQLLWLIRHFSGERGAAPLRQAPEAEKTDRRDPGEAPVEPGGEEPAAEGSGVEAPDADDLWQRVMQELRNRREITVLAFVQEGTPRIEGARFVLDFPGSHGFHKARSERPEIRGQIEEILRETARQELEFCCALREEPAPAYPASEDRVEVVREIFGAEKVLIVEEE